MTKHTRHTLGPAVDRFDPVLACAAKITGQPNEMEGEWRGIGDVSMMKDRKEAA